MFGPARKLFAALVALGALWATPAAAQLIVAANETFVSGTGNDANLCTATQPCLTFQGAHDKTIPGGVISVLDSANYLPVIITKPITINGGGLGFINGGANFFRGIIVNAGSTGRVVIEGVLINQIQPNNGLYGIEVKTARDVIIRNTVIKGFHTFGNGCGVSVISDSLVAVIIEGSTIANNRVGVCVASVAAQGTVRIFDSLISDSSVAGVLVAHALAFAEISDSQIIRSPKPLQIFNGGTIFTYGDNVVSPGYDAPTLVPKI